MRDVDNRFVLQCQRGAQWQRAKGELRALLELFPVTTAKTETKDRFLQVSALVDRFVEEVEDNELWS